MASRKPYSASDEKSPAERVVTAQRPAEPGTSNTSPAVPMSVVYKLLFFTAAMVIAPLGVYFITAQTIFAGNNTWAGALAAITANVVLIAYIIVAVQEDQGEQKTRVGKVE
ncbi:MAG: hypothetical protein Q9162_007511 [Coniocarpon cinnabarinum]